MKNDVTIYLGKNHQNGEKLFWIPDCEKNPHLITVGGSGSGKTETLKTIMLELKRQKVNSLIIDFHNDFKVFADNLIQIDESTLHPLEVLINEKPLDVAYKVSKMIAKIFSLGDIQEAIIRDSIKNFYHKSGIKDLKKKNDGDMELLPFSNFKDIILESEIQGSGLQKLIAKISVLFDVDLFMKADSTSISLDKIIKKLSVIELLEFPTDEVKALVADLLLNKLVNYLYQKGKKKDGEGYWLYVVIDEAHRMMYDGSPVELLLRESRKYGVGVILASQRPTDFSDTILANVSAILAFQSSLDKDAVFLSKQLRVNKENFQKLNTPGLGYALFSSDNDSKKVQIVPVKDREEYEEISKDFNEDEATEYFIKEQNRIKKEKEKLKNLEEENVNFIQEIKQLKQNSHNLTIRLSELKEELDKKDYTLQEYEDRYRKISREHVNFKHENEKFSEKISKLEVKNIKLSEENVAFKNIIKSHDQEINSLKENVTLAERKITTQDKKISELKTEQLEFKNKILQHKNKLKHIQYMILDGKDNSIIKGAYQKLLDNIKFDISENKNLTFCTKCHNEFNDKVAFCDICGNKLK